MKGLQSFYRSFYGFKFYRHFRRPDGFINKNFRIQFKVENPKQLYLHVHRNSGTYPCLIHTYDHGSRGNLNKCKSEKMVFDRVFFDFDVSNDQLKKIKKELFELRSQGLNNKKNKQVQLKEQLQNLIIKKDIVKPAIDEAKDFACNFHETFGKYPVLFFSGCKGCHAYAFFNQSKFINLNMAVSWFAEHVKKSFNYQTIDLAVTKDAQARLSRVPYSKHQLTGLTVVPFAVHDEYEVIIEKSLAPGVESFYREDFITDFHLHLQEIDKIEEHNAKIKENIEINNKKQYGSNKIKFVDDHRVFFKSILGEPIKEYPEKEYVMYQCPFPDHDDKKPSFRVHRCGYYCYGCLKKGNYWQFLKDYYGWDDLLVRNFLKKNLID
jgi:hypothetical protein